MAMKVVGFERARVRNARNAGKILLKIIGGSFNPAGNISIGWATIGGLYLKPPSEGGLCEGVITMPSANPLLRSLL